MRKNKAFALSIFLSFATSVSFSQIVNPSEPSSGRLNSPYSRFGVGNWAENRGINLRGMGGIANGYSSDHVINAFNPASYTYLGATSFEFGLSAASNSVRINELVTNSSTLTISHLNLAFPIIRKKLAMNIGYMPVTNVYYKTQDSSFVDGMGAVKNTSNGQGGLNYGFVGLSGGAGGFSVGVNAGYLFGSIKHSSYLNGVDSNAMNLRVTDISSKYGFSGFYFKAGAMYRATLKNNHYLSIGATTALKQDINTTLDDYMVVGTKPVSIIDPIVVDTISANYNQQTVLTMPQEYGFGIHFGKQSSYNIGLDVNYYDWSDFKLGEHQTGVPAYNNAYRLGLGGEVLPNPKATMKQYFSAITYRLGAYYGMDYLRINNTDINYWGMTVGAMLPFRPSPNSEQHGALNFALDFNNRGTLDNGLAREFTTRFTVGLKLNASWFQRRKYE
ncbi:MAG TPA: hypothetical protein VKZ76_04095 [Edaphocola sp.]|nr:hypothetical protein [Edaphocola sp.]